MASYFNLTLDTTCLLYTSWTNGTGVETLNNLQLLLQTILGIVGAIANAFRAAWEQNNVGEQLLQTLMNLLNTIIQIIASIGQALSLIHIYKFQGFAGEFLKLVKCHTHGKDAGTDISGG